MNPYETDELVAQYMEFHYGSTYYDVANYPAKCAQICNQFMSESRPNNGTNASPNANKKKALDLGCAVGRTTFELAHEFDEVIGVDLSARFIQCASDLKEKGNQDYQIITEGELVKSLNADLSKLGLSKQKNKVSFYQDDACNLGSQHKDYDLIFAGNLLDRLQDPKKFLESIHRYLRVGGLLVMSSPYTLLKEYTPRENWIGGYRENEQEISVFDGIKKTLEPHFSLVNKPIDVPFVIRETKRKFQHTVAELSCWKRVS